MTVRKTLLTVLSLILVGFSAAVGSAMAQSPALASTPAQDEKKNDETNLDTQLYLLVATNQGVDDPKLSAALDPVIKQLRASLPFKNYRLMTTLVNRVKNEGRLTLKWIGGPLIEPTTTASSNTPSFNEFRVNTVKLVTDESGRQIVRMEGFSFGARIPIQTGMVASNGASAPVVNYEPTGLTTDISMREGEAVVVGTLNVGPSGDAIILVMSAKRSNK